MKQPTTWILVADAGRARIFETHTRLTDGDFHLVETLEHKLQASREIGSDHPGRSVESGPSGQRHAVEPRSDPHDLQKTEFAVMLAALLEKAAGHGRFERLGVAAPPVLLGRLRPAFGAKTKAALMGEIDKDLTRLPLKELTERLKTEFA